MLLRTVLHVRRNSLRRRVGAKSNALHWHVARLSADWNRPCQGGLPHSTTACVEEIVEEEEEDKTMKPVLKHRMPRNRMSVTSVGSEEMDTAMEFRAKSGRQGSHVHARKKAETEQHGMNSIRSNDPAALRPEVRSRVQNDLKELDSRVREEFGSSRDPPLTEYQRLKGIQKAMTRRLDALLSSYQRRGAWEHIEAAVVLWDDAFPQFQANSTHHRVLIEYYGRMLNKQRRFEEVMEQLYVPLCKRRSENMLLSSSHIAEAILVACGHLRASSAALEVYSAMKQERIPLSMSAYFHLLNSLVNDETFREPSVIFGICKEAYLNRSLPLPFSLMPSVLTLAAKRSQLDQMMPLVRFPGEQQGALMRKPNHMAEFRLEVCLQSLWELGYFQETLHIYHMLMHSPHCSRAVKERLSKFLLRSTLSDHRRSAYQNDQESCDWKAWTDGVLVAMNTAKIQANYKSVSHLVPCLVEEEQVQSAEEMRRFFNKYPNVLEWNACVVSDAVVACVRARKPELVDEFIVLGLDQGMALRYTALESVIAFYYKIGMLPSYTKVADMVAALRKNKHIPLGIGVTEIGMIVNARLQRYDEVIRLFEDFARLDEKRKRILERRIILKTALEAYTALQRVDEVHAVQRLLDRSNRLKKIQQDPPTLLEREREARPVAKDQESRTDDT